MTWLFDRKIGGVGVWRTKLGAVSVDQWTQVACVSLNVAKIMRACGFEVMFDGSPHAFWRACITCEPFSIGRKKEDFMWRAWVVSIKIMICRHKDRHTTTDTAYYYKYLIICGQHYTLILLKKTLQIWCVASVTELVAVSYGHGTD